MPGVYIALVQLLFNKQMVKQRKSNVMTVGTQGRNGTLREVVQVPRTASKVSTCGFSYRTSDCILKIICVHPKKKKTLEKI